MIFCLSLLQICRLELPDQIFTLDLLGLRIAYLGVWLLFVALGGFSCFLRFLKIDELLEYGIIHHFLLPLGVKAVRLQHAHLISVVLRKQLCNCRSVLLVYWHFARP